MKTTLKNIIGSAVIATSLAGCSTTSSNGSYDDRDEVQRNVDAAGWAGAASMVHGGFYGKLMGIRAQQYTANAIGEAHRAAEERDYAPQPQHIQPEVRVATLDGNKSFRMSSVFRTNEQFHVVGQINTDAPQFCEVIIRKDGKVIEREAINFNGTSGGRMYNYPPGSMSPGNYVFTYTIDGIQGSRAVKIVP